MQLMGHVFYVEEQKQFHLKGSLHPVMDGRVMQTANVPVVVS